MSAYDDYLLLQITDDFSGVLKVSNILLVCLSFCVFVVIFLSLEYSQYFENKDFNFGLLVFG